MNYSKKSVRKKQQALHSTSKKWSRKIAFTFVQVFLIGMVGMAIIGVSAGIGAFRGILASAPEIGNIDVTPSGFSSTSPFPWGQQRAERHSASLNLKVSLRQVCFFPSADIP